MSSLETDEAAPIIKAHDGGFKRKEEKKKKKRYSTSNVGRNSDGTLSNCIPRDTNGGKRLRKHGSFYVYIIYAVYIYNIIHAYIYTLS